MREFDEFRNWVNEATDFSADELSRLYGKQVNDQIIANKEQEYSNNQSLLQRLVSRKPEYSRHVDYRHAKEVLDREQDFWRKGLAGLGRPGGTEEHVIDIERPNNEQLSVYFDDGVVKHYIMLEKPEYWQIKTWLERPNSEEPKFHEDLTLSQRLNWVDSPDAKEKAAISYISNRVGVSLPTAKAAFDNTPSQYSIELRADMAIEFIKLHTDSD